MVDWESKTENCISNKKTESKWEYITRIKKKYHWGNTRKTSKMKKKKKKVNLKISAEQKEIWQKTAKQKHPIKAQSLSLINVCKLKFQ